MKYYLGTTQRLGYPGTTQRLGMSPSLRMADYPGTTQRLGMSPSPGMIYHLPSVLPQRGNVLQPRVAGCPLPWICGAINHSINPNGVASEMAGCETTDTTPLGLIGLRGRFPRVAASPQPWAGRWNPVGIPGNPRAKANPIGVAVYPLQSKPSDEGRQSKVMRQHPTSALPQRGNVSQPIVAAKPLAWENGVTHSTNPNGVAFALAAHPMVDTTPLGLAPLDDAFPSVAVKPQRWEMLKDGIPLGFKQIPFPPCPNGATSHVRQVKVVSC